MELLVKRALGVEYVCGRMDQCFADGAYVVRLQYARWQPCDLIVYKFGSARHENVFEKGSLRALLSVVVSFGGRRYTCDHRLRKVSKEATPAFLSHSSPGFSSAVTNTTRDGKAWLQACFSSAFATRRRGQAFKTLNACRLMCLETGESHIMSRSG